jgi:hypothetical protein
MFKKRVSTYLVGALFLSLIMGAPTSAQAAVPTPQFWLAASASKISGTTWTNDGSVGGTATLASYAATPVYPAFQSSDSSVALNAAAGTGQYITGVAGSMTGISAITFEIVMKIPYAQANAVGSAGMVFGWDGSNYDIWMQQNNSIGFNTGNSDVYGIHTDTATPNSDLRGAFHTFTFVMSTDQTDAGVQRIYVDGVKQSTPYLFLNGTAALQSSKVFHSGGNFNIGRYGSQNNFPGSFNIRSFKLWLSNIGDTAVAESYNMQMKPTIHNITLTSGLTSAVYRTTSTIQSTSDVDEKVTFYFNGKRIPGCINIQTQNKQASCTWKPAAIGMNKITSQIISAGGNMTSSVSTINVSARSGKR